jgi:hypothetical protein
MSLTTCKTSDTLQIRGLQIDGKIIELGYYSMTQNQKLMSDTSKSIYGDVHEELPPHMPKPLGTPVKIHCFVDADHAGNLATRRSHTGVLIFVNMAPIVWYSKRQNTVKSSTFGSEFVALRTAVELIVGLRYKLRMFGVHIDQQMFSVTIKVLYIIPRRLNRC